MTGSCLPAKDKATGELRPGVWELRVNLGRDPITGKRRAVSRTFHGTKRDAHKALAALVTKVDAGEHRGTDETVELLLREYLRHVDTRLSPSTVKNYRRRIEAKLIPALGGIKLRKLNAGHLDRFYDALTAARAAGEMRGGSPADVGQYHAIIRAALAQAVDWGWVETNVALRASPPKLRRTPIVPPPIPVVLALINLARDGTGHPNSVTGPGRIAGNPALACFLRLAVASGARRGELCALQWADFTVDLAEVTIRRNVIDALGGGRWEVKDTKSHAERIVALDADTRAELASHYRRAEQLAAEAEVTLEPDSYVFTNEPDGSIPWRPEYCTLAFRRLCKHLGVSGVRLHDARHLSASLQIDAGVPLPTVSRRLGHAKQSTTSDIYVHARDERNAEAADVVGRALGPGTR